MQKHNCPNNSELAPKSSLKINQTTQELKTKGKGCTKPTSKTRLSSMFSRFRPPCQLSRAPASPTGFSSKARGKEFSPAIFSRALFLLPKRFRRPGSALHPQLSSPGAEPSEAEPTHLEQEAGGRDAREVCLDSA